MSLKSEAIKRFLTAARSLANQGMSKEAIMQFAKNEFGEITELFQRQIDNIFRRPASGIEKIKIKDPDFDNTVIKMQFDEEGIPFNPKEPLKYYGAPKKSITERMDDIKDTSKKLDDAIKEYENIYKPKQNKPDVYGIRDYDTTNMSEIKQQIIKTENKLGNLDSDSPDFKEKAKVLIDEIEELQAKLKDEKPRTDKYAGGRAGYQTGNQVTPQVDPRMLNSYDYNVRRNNAERTLNEMARNYDFSGLSTLGLNAKNYDSTPGPMTGIPAVGNVREKMIQDIMGRNQPYSLTPQKPPEPTDSLTGMLESSMLPNMADGSMRSLADINAIRDKVLAAQAAQEEQYYLTDPISGKQYKSEQEAIDDLGIITYNQRFASGGRAGHYTGGMVDVEPNLSDIGHGSDALMARTRLVAPNSQATTSTGLNYLLAEDNDNIRVPFSKGKLADVARRKFLKIASGIGAGIGALKTGILGLGEKAAPVVEKTVETVKQSVGSGTTPPPYFFKLVEKIKTLGDDTLPTRDKVIAKKYKDYVMEEDFAGNIEIVKKGGDDMFPEDVYMSYKVDEVPIKGKKGSTKVEEYEEFTARPDMEGKMKDVEPGVPDEVVNEGSVFEDNMTEFGMTKKADGGRIGFNKGKLAIETGRKFLEKVFGKETFENMIRNDPEMYRGMLEVVEMFRNRDKEGLKMYLQKFLPHMDDATVEDFIIGSGDTAGIEGQLIRLGSGRDYKGKIEMIKEADNRRKLNALDVSKMKPNAEGGLITMLGE